MVACLMKEADLFISLEPKKLALRFGASYSACLQFRPSCCSAQETNVLSSGPCQLEKAQ